MKYMSNFAVILENVLEYIFTIFKICITQTEHMLNNNIK